MHDLQCGTTITYLSTTSITIQSRNVSQRQAVSTQECILSIDRAWTRDSKSSGDLGEPLLTTHMAWIAPIERSEQVIQLARGVFQNSAQRVQRNHGNPHSDGLSQKSSLF